ncbi:MAG: sigma-54-dependent Fis family transcriptional regulator [Cyclobacteriaceae bacterium]|nr:sigma-54-dependent Fis family transcriptional regulator [Cyclobacteriaceae bacterium]
MGKIKGNILIVDDDPFILDTAKMYLKQEFESVKTEAKPEGIPELLNTNEIDVVLLDMNFKKGDMEGKEGIYWLEKILETDPTIIVIMITAYGDVNLAVEAIRKGAMDFVMKPWKNEKLLATTMSAIKLRASKIEVDKLRHTQQELSRDLNSNFKEIVGNSPAIRRVYDLIEKIADTDANILILGENGTGKELIARAIHRLSSRKEEVFLRVDLGALTETLFESELFGHVKGAFTDAIADKPGSLEMASGGTLFLDEIGNVSLPLQAKLLSVLQQRELKRVGSNKIIPFDIRLVCATNMPIYDLVRKDKHGKIGFRQDLLYRINTVEIKLPPLRERTEDIPALMDHFIHIYCLKYHKPIMKVDNGLIRKMNSYNWPGNIRELQHSVEKVVILNEGKVIRDLNYFIQQKEDIPNSDEHPKTLKEMEKLMIKYSVEQNMGNLSKVAKELGITRATLYRKMEKFEI